MSLPRKFERLAHRHSLWAVWNDFLLFAATSIANSVDKREKEWREREDDYLAAAKRYKPKEMQEFADLLGEVTLALEKAPSDVLGSTFMELEMGNKWRGQFFTPDSLCQSLFGITVDDSFRDTIKHYGFATVLDPAIGGGAIPIGLFQSMLDAHLNPQTQLHVTGVDVDIKAVHMSYIQLSLLGVPAVIIHGNALSNEEFSYWYTPAHVMWGWNRKLRAGGTARRVRTRRKRKRVK